MELCLILAGAIIIIGFIKAFRSRHDLKAFSLAATTAISLAISVLAFPYYWNKYHDYLISILTAFRYGISALSMKLENDVIKSLQTDSTVYTIYHHFMYALYILGPLCASLLLLSYSVMVMENIKSFFSRSVHVFTSLNEKSLLVAESITKEKKRASIIFLNVARNKQDNVRVKAASFGSILLAINEKKLNLHRNRHYEFYVIEDNCEKALARTTELCSSLLKKKNFTKENVIVRSFISHDALEYSRLLDAQYADKVYLRYIDEDNASAIEIFRRIQPQIVNKEHCELVIISLSSVGLAVLRHAIFLLNEPGSTSTIHIFDPKAKEVISSLKAQCPEVLNSPKEDYLGNFYIPDKNYDLRFYSCSDTGSEILEQLATISPDAVIICSDSDKNNFETANKIKRLYASLNSDLSYPPICAAIRNPELHKLVSVESDLIFFADQSIRYDYQHVLNPELEDVAKRIHLAYVSDSYKDVFAKSRNEQEKILNDTGYYRMSNVEASLALGLMMEKYQAWILAQKTDDSIPDEQFVANWLKDNRNLTLLGNCEHDRWNAFTRLQGYRLPDASQIESIIMKTNGKKVKDDELLLHPALVTVSDLPAAEKQADDLLSIYTNENRHTRYVRLDQDILSKMNDILRK